MKTAFALMVAALVTACGGQEDDMICTTGSTMGVLDNRTVTAATPPTCVPKGSAGQAPTAR